ncbi:hypothetical protein CR513_28164, partial [Mucuna pruriens]
PNFIANFGPYLKLGLDWDPRELGEKLDKVGKGLDSVQKNTQSVNVKVEALSRERDEKPKVVSIHENERSFEEGNYSEWCRSSRSTIGERHERHGRVASSSIPNAPKTSNIKYFRCLGKGHIASQCPNRRVKVKKDNREVEGESSHTEHTSSNKVESLSDDSYYEGDLMVIRRMMSSHIGDEAKTHKIFSILGNLISMIIDGGSCVNVASERLVKKLALPTFVHPRSYKFQWLSERGELLMDKQVEVAFTLGRYEDRMTCDQFDKKVIHDGVTNKFTFLHLGQRFMKKKQMKVKRESERKTKSKLKKKEKESEIEKRKERGKENEFQDVLPKDVPHGLQPLRDIEHHIDLTLRATLPNRTAYRMNLEEAKEIEKQVRESMSPCSILVILIPKNDGTCRICTNYRQINNILVRYRHPIPGRWMNGKWLITPFGLTNAPSTFMRLMNHILRSLIGKCVVVYFDLFYLFG